MSASATNGTCHTGINPMNSTTTLSAGLQAVDYFLWALQRAYERGEPRYLEYVWQRVSLVHDIDDTREKPYGEYYSKIRPMDIEAIKRGSGI